MHFLFNATCICKAKKIYCNCFNALIIRRDEYGRILHQLLSTADLTKEYFDKRGIRYVCFHYELGGTDYLDDLGQTMPPAELYRRMLGR